MGFLVVRTIREKKKKEKGKGCEIFVTILSIFLIFFLFFSRMDYKFFSSHPFPEREVAALKFLPFQRAHLFASGIPIVIREPTVRQSGQHRCMYQLIEIPVHIIRTRAAVNSDRWSNNSERVLP